MNLLAHFYLSGPDPKTIVGNYMGDFVKGDPTGHFPEEIIYGIELHRKIDDYTDNHPTVRKSKRRLSDSHGHFKGILVDIFYDHFLAKRWGEYSDTPLSEFSNRIYELLGQYRKQLPKGAEYMFRYMKRGNWLVNYAHITGIEKTLRGLSGRTRYKSNLSSGTDDLLANYSELENDFSEFFPDIVEYLGERKNGK